MLRTIIQYAVAGTCACAYALCPAQAQEAAASDAATAVAPSAQSSGKKNTAAIGSINKPKPTVTAREQLPSTTITMTVGAIEIFPVKGKVQRVALGSGSILSTTTVDDSLLVIAEQVGVTSMMVWTNRAVQTYRVQVVPKDMTEVRAKVDELIRGMPRVTAIQIGAELVLTGSAHKEALAQLSKALQGTPGLVFNLKEDGGSPYTRSVLFRLHFIEVKRSLIENIGIDWAQSANGPTFGAMGVLRNDGVYSALPQVTTGQDLLGPTPPFVKYGASKGGLFLGLATAISSRINAGISTGDIRVLASPELTAKSGGKAKLQVGGEVPIPTAAGFGAVNVVYKPYGIMFSIEPEIGADDVITAKISTELSQIDPAVTVGGFPGFLTRTTSTDVSLKAGEVVALSGLVNSEMSNAIDRVPGISAVPVLGRLFRSDDFRNNKTELFVLLEPQIITAGDGLASQLRDRGLTTKKEFEDKVLELQPKPEPYVDPQRGRGVDYRN